MLAQLSKIKKNEICAIKKHTGTYKRILLNRIEISEEC